MIKRKEKVYKAQRLFDISSLRTVSMSPSDSQELLDVYNLSGYAEWVKLNESYFEDS